MPGVVIRGGQEPVTGINVRNWNDDPQLRLKPGEDCRNRYTTWVRNIVLHTTKGWPDGQNPKPQELRDGLGPDFGGDVRCAQYWATSTLNSGAHLVVDFDGSVVCLADLATEAAYHAGEVNEVSIGIEIYQGSQAELYRGQLDTVVKLVDWLTRRFRIQRQFHGPYTGVCKRMATGARDVVGIYGHRDVTTNRSKGDPGDFVFDVLAEAGYEKFNFAKNEDVAVWKGRQHQLVLDGHPCTEDGIPGPGTAIALLAAGHRDALWVPRPGD